MLSQGEVSPSYRLYMYYFPSIYFLSLISESCYLNLPLTITHTHTHTYIYLSRHSQAIDSAISKHLLTINSCRTSYEDDCFSVLYRTRDKSQLKFLEVIYESPLSMKAVKQSCFKYFWGTARYWGDLGFFFFLFFFLHPVSGNPNYIIYTTVFT